MTESKNPLDWFKFADMDLYAAKSLFENTYPVPLEIVCYHCQQAAEKYIKGVSVNLKKELVKTHDLGKLCNLIENKVDVNSIIIPCAILSSYVTVTRYPMGFSVDEAQTKVALNAAKKVKDWAENIITAKDKGRDSESSDVDNKESSDVDKRKDNDVNCNDSNTSNNGDKDSRDNNVSSTQ